MKVKILTHSANWNGQRLVKGSIVEMPDSVAKVFISTAQAEEYVDPDAVESAKRPKAK